MDDIRADSYGENPSTCCCLGRIELVGLVPDIDRGFLAHFLRKLPFALPILQESKEPRRKMIKNNAKGIAVRFLGYYPDQVVDVTRRKMDCTLEVVRLCVSPSQRLAAQYAWRFDN